jgi:hypothetical protein
MRQRYFAKLNARSILRSFRCYTLKNLPKKNRKGYVVPPKMSGLISDLAKTML